MAQARFEEALAAGDSAAAAELFADDSYWRDLVAFTWNIKTVEGPAGVQDMLDATLAHVQAAGWHTSEPPTEADGVTDAWLEFETEVGRGSGLPAPARRQGVDAADDALRAQGYEEPKGPGRPRGVEHGAERDRLSWLEQREQEAAELGYASSPTCVIVGGGQGGIALGARLRQLDVPTIIVERNERPGDSWRKRYKSLCLHDPVWYDHLPYIKFPENWPVFSPKDKIGDWLEMYTKVMELNYWGSSTVARRPRSTARRVERGRRPRRRGGRAAAEAARARHGHVGAAEPPADCPGMDDFAGEQHHSSQHPGPDGYVGKKVVVIGSNNSAHDICAALWEAGVDVTMVQRSSTHIVRSSTLMDIGLGALYSEQAVAAGDHDREGGHDLRLAPVRASCPTFQIPLYDQMRERDADFYARLEAAGFDLDWGEDGSGLFMKYLRRGSGYYIDVGASELVAIGRHQARERAGRAADRGRGGAGGRHARCRPTSSSTPPATAR